MIKVGVIGNSPAPLLELMGDVAREVTTNSLTTRRNLLERISKGYVNSNLLHDISKQTPKQMKRMSRGFHMMYRYIEPLRLEQYHNGFKHPSITELRRITITLNSLTSGTAFARLDFEDTETDYFQLAIGVMILLKSISAKNFKVYAKETKLITQFNLVASDIAIRLYSMYVDTRMESAMEDENVVLR